MIRDIDYLCEHMDFHGALSLATGERRAQVERDLVRQALHDEMMRNNYEPHELFKPPVLTNIKHKPNKFHNFYQIAKYSNIIERVPDKLLVSFSMSTSQAIKHAIEQHKKDLLELIPEVHKIIFKDHPIDESGRLITRTFHYRNTTVIADGKRFCDHELIVDKLKEMVETQKSMGDEFDPFYKAAWLHNALVGIHPFLDGNGRVSRIIASIPLIESGNNMIFVAEKKKYVEIIRSGDINALARYFSVGPESG